MPTMTLSRQINAPVELVFKTVAHIDDFAKAQPQIVKFEFLSEQHVGAGTRFRETRMKKGKEAATVLEVTEYAANNHTRMIADSHGAIWDTLFTVDEEKDQEGSATTLTMAMTSRPYKLMPRLMLPLFNGMIKKEVAKDLDRVKSYCEAQAEAAAKQQSG